MDGQQGSAETGDGRRNGKSGDSGPDRRDADRLGSHFTAPKGVQHPASGALAQLDHQEGDHGEGNYGQDQEQAIVGKVPRANSRAGNPRSLEKRGPTAADPRELDHHRVEEEGEGQRRDSQPDAAKPEDRQRQESADNSSQTGTYQGGGEHRQVVPVG